MKSYIFFILFFLIGKNFVTAQETSVSDSLSVVSFDCGIAQTKQKLSKKEFASTTPLHLRVNNSNYVYATLQLGKRKNKVFLYIQILDKNVCLKKDKILDVFFKTGEVVTYKNRFALNCDGFFAKQLTKKEFQKLRLNDIDMIKLYTYDKNYELYVTEVQNIDIDNQLDCLSAYKIKKTDEVKIKKNKNEPASGT
ncbi:hypothetical protein PGH12_15765 [Chryseobacterium wangxinyae]|uniref:hypothetical protein n=1 Tax=Chryseobacterium sp. CY350 TaxID=2997336 RepID=UPI00226EA301|nr:hypothetical protein [Chryseobacterium sp. CY350]MCY0977822.1 hypothetical protein [Chryseobacterium sp. CY350]WBZ94910.1 hypothetical protein PGH12_15765 [Chryseobacterium sp. CY350]